jgi:DNA-binding NarL/FixJ family response regulator
MVVVNSPAVRETVAHTLRAGLPDGSGIALVRELRAAGWQRGMVVATSDDPYSVRAAVGAGIRCYVVSAAGTGVSRPATERGEGVDSLSAREIQVLQLVAEGKSNKDIGVALGLSALTVKSHLARIARKLGTGDRAEMVATSLRSGVIA